MPGIKMYTRDYLLQKLKEKSEEKRDVVTGFDIEIDPFMPSRKTYRYRFGSITNAIKEAGLIPKNEVEKLKLSKKNMLAGLQRLYQEKGYVPRHQDIDKCEYTPSHGYYYKIFGSLEDAYKLIGIKYRKGRRAQ
ncbi:MAG: homing endonuclease associated repeat-containing protein [bacterium]